MSDSFVTSWTVACQAPLSMRFPRQEDWSGLPFPFPGDLPDSGIEPGSLVSLHWQADSLPCMIREAFNHGIPTIIFTINIRITISYSYFERLYIDSNESITFFSKK